MIDRLMAFDHAAKKSWIIVCPGARETVLGFSDVTSKRDILVAEAGDVLEDIQRRLGLEGKTEDEISTPDKVKISYDMEKEAYMEMVRKTREYIAAGDIFQANLSLRVSADIGDTDPWKIYTILRKINPSPFAAYVDFDDYHIVSSSPERLVRVIGKNVDTRPIAGTRPRGRDLEEDEMMSAELLLNEKERAEHIMLIDLERNDLGKVADYGTVNVDELMITEKYSHVIHIVSNVKGILAEGKDCFSVIRATFPGGTITGVPKVRCMEIIDEIEPTSRGPYTGSVGYIGFNGNMDLNIIIRTFLVKDGRAYVQAGAGIVADSDPEREYYESLKKAEALIKTLENL
jgi:anthranilate/para-aminobenzoate synthase component I